MRPVTVIKIAISSLIVISVLAIKPVLASANNPKQAKANNKPDATFYLVRHAEKAKDHHNDPNLTTQGQARAEWLASCLADKSIRAIYSTQYRRTKQTGQPLADKLSLKIIPYDAKEQKAFAKAIKKQPKNSLIVGHSNTLTPLINYLTGQKLPDIDYGDYNKLFKIEWFDSKPKVTTLTMNLGKACPTL
ncbi:MAG: phosphoglycerate mutase family protein [Kangiellaceae bacterium]|jgi:phosphohistidine phosphatase SixA|nr:phosphoglycerate mutase family protein [Kangiellaceae bacterium]